MPETAEAETTDSEHEAASHNALKDETLSDGVADSRRTHELQALLDKIADELGKFGLSMADIAGGIETTADQSVRTFETFDGLSQGLEKVKECTQTISTRVTSARSVSKTMTDELSRSQGDAQTAIGSIGDLIEDVRSFEA